MSHDRYRSRGVSPQKEDVHAAIAGLDRGLFPQAFCKIVPDSLSGDENHCIAMHADGAGTKASLAYLYYRETGDAGIFRGIAQDALVMNTDDLMCVGALGPFLLSNTIGRNARHVPGEVIGELIAGYENMCDAFRDWGIDIVNTGGETADVGDVVRTVIVDATAVARMKRESVVANDRVRPGDVIVGLASSGTANYEPGYNSGVGSNGLTSARHDLLHHDYATAYPESFEPGMPQELAYCGPFRLSDPLPESPLTVGQALLSPTRTYAPILKPLLMAHRPLISALVHCTGGGQTKCLSAGQGIDYIKNNLFSPPPLFKTIQEVTRTTWLEMYQVFNMGHRMEIIGDAALIPVLEDLGREHGVDVRQIGVCESIPDELSNRVTLTTPDGQTIHYP